MSDPIQIRTIDDLLKFPVLTREVGMMTPVSGGSPGTMTSSAPLGQVAENALRGILGWRLQAKDPQGFLAALRQSFICRQVDGRAECAWTPRGSVVDVQADLGAITGAQASLYARARNMLDQVVPLLDGLHPLRAESDPEDTVSIRSLVRTELTELVQELGILGGPRVARVDDLFRLLLGPAPDLGDPEKVEGQLRLLRDRFGLNRSLVNTVEEEKVLTDFLTAIDYINSLKASWDLQRGAFQRSDTADAFLGTQLVLLSRELAVTGESLRELGFILDSVFLGAAEQATLVLRFPSGQPPLTLAELLDWTERVVTREGPVIIRETGKDGVIAFRSTLARLSELFEETLALARTATGGTAARLGTPRVLRALEELAEHLKEALRLSVVVRRLTLTVADPASLVAENQVELTVFGENLLGGPGLHIRLVGPDGSIPLTVIEGTGVTLLDEGAARATFDLENAPTGTWSVQVVNPDGDAVVLARALTISRALVPAALKIEELLPRRGQPGETITRAILQGEGFQTDAAIDLGQGVTFQVKRRNPDFLSGEIVVDPAAVPGQRLLTLTQAGGRTHMSQAFEVEPLPPEIDGIDPASASMGSSGVSVTIKGRGFLPGSKVSFGKFIGVRKVKVVDAETITATIDIKADVEPGEREVTVTTPRDDEATVDFDVEPKEVLAPLNLISINPTTAQQGEARKVTITGTGFQQGLGASFGNGIDVIQTKVSSGGTQLEVDIQVAPTATPGKRNVRVANPDDQKEVKKAFFEVVSAGTP
jgi:hypothetical protein